MYELDHYESNRQWSLPLWNTYSKETKEANPRSNPNLVHFREAFLERLKPEKCNIKYLWHKYVELRDRLTSARKEFKDVIDEVLSISDVMVIPCPIGIGSRVHVIKKQEGEESRYGRYSITFQNVSGISSWREHEKLIPDIAKKYARIYNSEARLRMLTTDIMTKICKIMKYKLETSGLANVGAFYEDVDGEKLMFITSAVSGRMPDYCESVSFVGVFSDKMNIDNMIFASEGRKAEASK